MKIRLFSDRVEQFWSKKSALKGPKNGIRNHLLIQEWAEGLGLVSLTEL
jgi:hypothetical protein